MNCNDVVKEIPNYCYGEISSETEEQVESHLTDCPTCQTELARHRKFLTLLDERAALVEAGLLVQCRSELSATLRRQVAADAAHGASWHAWHRVTEYLRDFSRVQIPFKVPVGALALVALGFVAARYTPEKFGGFRGTLTDPLFSSVRSVEPNAGGQVKIAVDETRRHMVSGSIEDPQIQELLVSGVTDGSNPGVRLQSIQVLHDRVLPAGAGGDSEQVRDALLGALRNDPSAAVRLKALEGLKQFAGDAAVRSALGNVLQKDDDANVRIQAIELLAAHRDDSRGGDSMVGTLQNLVQKEENPVVREQMTQLLAQLKASVGTY